jgi:hypothetical protein
MTELETQQINEAVQRAWHKSRQIDDVIAQLIARAINFGCEPLREFVRTGAISPGMTVVLQAIGEYASGPEEIWIAAFEQYCQDRQGKGPIPHWGGYRDKPAGR